MQCRHAARSHHPDQASLSSALNDTVDGELDALPAATCERGLRASASLIATVGLERVTRTACQASDRSMGGFQVVAWNGERFVAVSYEGVTLHSADGDRWDPAEMMHPLDTLHDVAWG